ncbi:MAG: FAD-dependent oxidoreductase [Chloroflexi bacterium]|nr:MAG: FAD-dependent oxidoreductase [Chloroflexota bacterium]
MKTQVVIIGGGPGGTTMAMYLRRYGVETVIVEKEEFPRFHIGESMTNEAGGVVRELGLADEMDALSFQHKHGVKVYGSHSWFVPVMSRMPDGSLMENFTWNLRRSSFDRMMLEKAVSRGTNLIQGQATRPISGDDGSIKGVMVRLPDGSQLEIESEVLIDASGQNTWLANLGGITGPKYLGNYDRQLAIFSHITGGTRDLGGPERDEQPGNTLIFYKEKYHWGWWIPVDDKTVSLGVVSPAAYFLDQKEKKEDFYAREIVNLHPNLTSRLSNIEIVEEVRSIKNYSYQVNNFTGKGFICLGDAHRFVDPIFSFGMSTTMKEAQFAAPYICDYLNGVNRDQPNPFSDYQLYVEKGIDVLEDCLDGFWEHPMAFAYLVHARYRDEMIDVFAGRIYEGQPSPATNGFRSLLKRERTYDDASFSSIPIGSRYHPERAPIWHAESEDLRKLEEALISR